MIKPTIKIIDVSDEVWMWVHQKYGMSRIVKIFYSFETNNCSYLAVPDNGQLNQQKKQTYDQQLTNSKIMMTITIIIDHKRTHCSINMYN